MRRVKIGVSLVMLAIAGVLTLRAVMPAKTTIARAWFYDMNTQQLFAGDPFLLPPIKAPSGAIQKETPATSHLDGLAGVRAYVFACGDPSVEANRKIGWLESFTPDFKAKYPDYGSLSDLAPSDFKGSRLVQLPGDTKWLDLQSKEAEAIVKIPDCPDGKSAVPLNP